MIKITREMKWYSLVVGKHIERLTSVPVQINQNNEFHFKNTYNFFNHIHTPQHVLVLNEV